MSIGTLVAAIAAGWTEWANPPHLSATERVVFDPDSCFAGKPLASRKAALVRVEVRNYGFTTIHNVAIFVSHEPNAKVEVVADLRGGRLVNHDPVYLSVNGSRVKPEEAVLERQAFSSHKDHTLKPGESIAVYVIVGTEFEFSPSKFKAGVLRGELETSTVEQATIAGQSAPHSQPASITAQFWIWFVQAFACAIAFVSIAAMAILTYFYQPAGLQANSNERLGDYCKQLLEIFKGDEKRKMAETLNRSAKMAAPPDLEVAKALQDANKTPLATATPLAPVIPRAAPMRANSNNRQSSKQGGGSSSAGG